MKTSTLTKIRESVCQQDEEPEINSSFTGDEMFAQIGTVSVVCERVFAYKGSVFKCVFANSGEKIDISLISRTHIRTSERSLVQHKDKRM